MDGMHEFAVKAVVVWVHALVCLHVCVHVYTLKPIYNNSLNNELHLKCISTYPRILMARSVAQAYVHHLCVHVILCALVYMCVRTCVYMCVRACMRAHVFVDVCVGVRV